MTKRDVAPSFSSERLGRADASGLPEPDALVSGTEMPLPFARPTQLSLEVAAYVRELILSGQVASGQALTIDRLARTLGISATPIREGLLSLRGEGFVDFEPRRGFKVTPLSEPDIRDLYWAQGELAAELARRAAQAASPDIVAGLGAIQSAMRTALDHGDHQAIESLNHDFHRTINRSANAPKLTWLLQSAVRYAPRRFYASIPGWMEASLDDHQDIVTALRAHDTDGAAEAMRRHIRHAGDLLVENLERHGLW